MLGKLFTYGALPDMIDNLITNVFGDGFGDWVKETGLKWVAIFGLGIFFIILVTKVFPAFRKGGIKSGEGWVWLATAIVPLLIGGGAGLITLFSGGE